MRFSPKRPHQIWDQPSFLFDGYLGSYPGVKWQKRGVNQSSPSSAEVGIEWSYASAPPICFRGVVCHNFTFFLFVDIFLFDRKLRKF